MRETNRSLSLLRLHNLQIVYKDGVEKVIHNLADWPDPALTPFYRVRAAVSCVCVLSLALVWGLKNKSTLFSPTKTHRQKTDTPPLMPPHAPHNMYVQDMRIEEPVVEATILTPVSCLGPITTCLKDRCVCTTIFTYIYIYLKCVYIYIYLKWWLMYLTLSLYS